MNENQEERPKFFGRCPQCDLPEQLGAKHLALQHCVNALKQVAANALAGCMQRDQRLAALGMTNKLAYFLLLREPDKKIFVSPEQMTMVPPTGVINISGSNEEGLTFIASSMEAKA